MAKSRTTVHIDDDLRQDAQDLGINISATCRDAVRAAVEVARLADEAGPGFETVEAQRWIYVNDDEILQDVEFIGREVADFGALRYYATPKGRIVGVEEERMYIWESVDEMEAEPVEDEVIRKVKEGLGLVPTFLDI